MAFTRQTLYCQCCAISAVHSVEWICTDTEAIVTTKCACGATGTAATGIEQSKMFRSPRAQKEIVIQKIKEALQQAHRSTT